MDEYVPRKRGRPRKYHTEEERKQALLLAARKSAQKKREQKNAAGKAPQALTRSSSRSIVGPKDLQTDPTENCGPVKIPTDSVRLPCQPQRPNIGTPSQSIGCSSILGSPQDYLAPGVRNETTPLNPAFNLDASDYAPWHMAQDLDGPVVAQDAKVISNLGDDELAILHHAINSHPKDSTIPHPNNSLEMTRPLRKEHRANYPPISHSSLKKTETFHFPDRSQGKERMISAFELEDLVSGLEGDPESQNLRRRTLAEHKTGRDAKGSREQPFQTEKTSTDMKRELELSAKRVKYKPKTYHRILPESLSHDPEQHQDLLDALPARHAQRAAEEGLVRTMTRKWEKIQSAHEEGKAWQEVTSAQVAAGRASTTEELTQSLNALKRAEVSARQMTSARKAEENAQKERLQRAAQEEEQAAQRALEQAQALAEQSQDSFDRHICYISDCLQANSFGRHHIFRTDGLAVYVKVIKPSIYQIQKIASSETATFAIQYVGLMALTHVIRLIYVHRGGKIGGEILWYYKANARLHNIDELTGAMLVIVGKVDDNERQWLKTHQGAAGVLMQEMLEVWPMICAVGPIQVQQNLANVLWVIFRHEPVPSFQ